jgi:hypothetical protein
MTDIIKVTTLKGFYNGDNYARAGSVIEVSESRAKELELNGLIRRAPTATEPSPEPKAAPTPKNKKNPEPDNK